VRNGGIIQAQLQASLEDAIRVAKAEAAREP
jgi:hypothetical protein